METEYIEKQAARPDAFCEGVSCQECPFLKDPLYGGCRVDDFIMALPSADVRPVVRGRWRKIGNNSDGTSDYECSACLGIMMHVPDDDGHPMVSFCSMCGADMRGGDAE